MGAGCGGEGGSELATIVRLAGGKNVVVDASGSLAEFDQAYKDS